MLTKKQEQKISVSLCYYLRHKPEDLGIILDSEGFVSVDSLIQRFNVVEKNNLNKLGLSELCKEQLEYITSKDKQDRYHYSGDKTFIGCRQGHSTPMVDIQFESIVLEQDVYHGTSPKFLDSIMEQGLIPKTRHYVHLSKDIEAAKRVGKRHSKMEAPVILVISKDAPLDFMITTNGVIHVSSVPPEYITVMES